MFQRTGASDIYARPPPRLNPGDPGGPGGGGGRDPEGLDDFSDDETPLTEPIYGGR